MPQKLRPHTPEWFDAFHRINPIQADLTERLIRRVGHERICTTCGDKPVGDFIVTIIPYITARLCPACKDIYLRNYGDHFEPMDAGDGDDRADENARASMMC